MDSQVPLCKGGLRPYRRLIWKGTLPAAGGWDRNQLTVQGYKYWKKSPAGKDLASAPVRVCREQSVSNQGRAAANPGTPLGGSSRVSSQAPDRRRAGMVVSVTLEAAKAQGKWEMMQAQGKWEMM